MHEATWTIRPGDVRQAAVLARELGLSEITASVLVRRGYADPSAAAAFLAGEAPGHDPFRLGDMREACDRIRAAIAAGTRICVHGDYDVDGICATALAVLVLRDLGANADWHLPSRFEEGYGVSSETLSRLGREGYGLVLTVDCGITAVAEVADAKAAGLDVIVTDHHRPGDELPDCPLVVTRPSDYPFPELCGTGVVYKLAEALLGAEPGSGGGGSAGAPAAQQGAATPARKDRATNASRATSTWSRWRRSPTSCRSSTRTARSRLRACAGSRRPRVRACVR